MLLKKKLETFLIAGIFPVVLLLLLVQPYCHGHSKGAPLSSCKTMAPGHGAKPQTSAPPYNMTIIPLNDGTFRVKLSALVDYFEGYLIRVKMSPKLPGASDDFSGSFIGVPDESSILDCGSQKVSRDRYTCINPAHFY